MDHLYVTERIRARRDALAAQKAQALAQYAELERMLADLDRSIAAMHGGLQELEELLATVETNKEEA